MTEDELLKLVRHHFNYDPITGVLSWLVPRAKRTPTGSRFGGINKNSGYRQGKFLNKSYQEHRLIWFIYYGKWPEGEIDHKNHDRSDNRLQNLRDVPRIHNSRNQKMHKVNSSGKMGVSWYKPKQKWVARIRDGKKDVYLGYFINLDDAIKAREDAEVKYGYHKNHGK